MCGIVETKQRHYGFLEYPKWLKVSHPSHKRATKRATKMPKPIKIATKRGIKYKADPVYRGKRLGSKRFDTMRAAVAYDREMVSSAEKGGGSENKTLHHALEKYGAEISPNQKGYRWELIRLDKFKLDPLARIKLAAIEHEDLELWIDRRRRDGVKDSSILRELSLLSSVLRECRTWRWMRHNPIELIAKHKRPKEGESRIRRVTETELDILTKQLNVQDPIQTLTQEVGVAFLLAIETGMRCGEMTKVTGPMLWLEEYHIKLPKEITKTGIARAVPLSDRAIELISMLPRARDGRLFRVKAASVDTLFRKAKKKCQIETDEFLSSIRQDVHLTFHDSRHEAASRLAKRYEVLELCKVMGWSDPKMAMVYYNPTALELAMKGR